MQYKTRNLIVLLSVMFIVMLFGGYFVVWSYPSRIEKSQNELNDIQRKIKQLDGIDTEFFTLEKLLLEKEEKLASIDKQIEADITTANVYDYLNKILNYSGIIEFNLSFKEQKNFGSYGFNTYNLQGDAEFRRIYNFINYLEQGPHVYEIVRLKLQGMESKNEETDKMELILPFDMEIKAYFATVEDLQNDAKKLSDVKVATAQDPFYPSILRNLPLNTDALLEVEQASLKAIIPGKALIADNGGEIHVLREGDRVYLGYLTRIDTENNLVEFTLNKGGIIEKIVLNLEFDANKDKK